MWRSGSPTTTSTSTTGITMGHGRAMTTWATRYQKVSGPTVRSGWTNGSASALTRGPRIASSAGRKVSA